MTPQPESWRHEALENLEDRLEEKHARTNRRVDELQITVNAWREEIRRDFVSRQEMNLRFETIQERYAPVVRIVYGLVTAIGLGVIGAILALVLRK